jgi:BirA family biotin operon repressor/biotin-[acetyl-CoA-carboxylase] ligase
MTLAAAVAVAKTLEEFRFKPQIKWPNDLLLDGKKVCGILTEMGPKKDKMISVVLGIGINMNQTTRDFPTELKEIATSLYRFSGRKINREVFFQKLLTRLEETHHWVAERRFSKVLSEWRQRSATLGRQVKVIHAYHVLYGQAVDVDEKGALLVRNDTGLGDVQILQF